MKSRRAAREWALKILYSCDLRGDSLELVLPQIQPYGLQTEYARFMAELLKRTMEQRVWIDRTIRELVEKWELQRIAKLDLLILRLAICELFFFNDIPPKVTINEAIEIAKKYSTEKSGKFVNGILDAAVHKKLLVKPSFTD